MKRTSIAAMAAVLALSAPLMSGCFSGQGATTNMQASMNSGNGVEAEAGDIDIEDATLVLGPEGSGTATLITVLVNNGLEADALVGATIIGVPALVTSEPTTIPGGGKQSFGIPAQGETEPTQWINAYGLEVEPSAYVPVQLMFQRAGIVELSLLTVPAIGMYEGIAPSPTAAPVG